MKINTLISVGVLAALLAGCGSNGVTLAPTSNVTNPPASGGNNGGGNTTNPCASYAESGQSFQGSFDSSTGNCTYSSTFVSDTKPLENDLTIPALTNNGVHIFQDSLWVGEDVNGDAAAQGVRVPQDGEGPALTIEAGARIAFSAPEDYVRVARGSRIFAEGRADAPIIFSATQDLVDGTATQGDRGLWGGLQINGNGLTNKCTDAQRAATSNNPHSCHVTAEGRPSTYGGNNNAENSGVLRYVQVRHAGYQVVDGDELNGVTLNGVGSGTTIEYVQTYSTLDDGFEMFGGAVDMKNIVAVNVGDDSIDYSEGYVGDIQYALVVHTSGSNRCIEGDNTGSSRDDAIAPYSKLRISNMTCITSSVDENQGAYPTSKGDSEGPLFREGVYFEMYNSIVTSNADGMSSNECLEIVSTQSVAGVNAGYSAASGNVIACTEPLKTDDANFDMAAWWNAENALVSDPANLPAQIIEGQPANDTAYVTAATLQDANGAPISVTVFDVSKLDDDYEAQAAPVLGSSSFFDQVDFIGAVKEGEDWVSGWTVGLE
ncbi:hypothetical protein F6455_10855 [Proteobacteria bacterium 005FR1]|nr:hypothetical protein [Proteobacteria bacterium 005FR1]